MQRNICLPATKPISWLVGIPSAWHGAASNDVQRSQGLSPKSFQRNGKGALIGSLQISNNREDGVLGAFDPIRHLANSAVRFAVRNSKFWERTS